MAHFLRRLFFLVFTIGLLALLTPSAALADIAPPQPPLGSGVIPGQETTQVRMMAETVQIVLPDASAYDNWQAATTAQFTMRNLGDTAESMAVRFPMFMTVNYIDLTEGNCNNINTTYPAIQNFQAQVNAEPATIRLVYNQTSDPRPCWAEFQASFPPGKDVKIEVRYQIQGQLYGHGVTNYLGFPYILATGRGWQGTIGSADITVSLPYPLSDLNVMDISPGGQISGNEVRWHFADFEPKSNTEIWVANPGLWQALLNDQQAVQANPRDGEAWGRIGKGYKGIFLLERGSREGETGARLFRLSQEAYQKSVDLLPKDADWHYGYGDLLCETAFWNYGGSGLHLSNTDLLTACMEQLRLALQINPDHAKTLDLLRSMSESSGLGNNIVTVSGNQADFLILTPGNYHSPTPWQTRTSTPTPSPSPTSLPAASATFTSTVRTAPSITPARITATPLLPTPTPGPTATVAVGQPLCGALILPLLAAVWLGWRIWGQRPIS
jgi:hypothetical protein